MSDSHAYLVADRRTQTEFTVVPEVPTAVVKVDDYPMSDLPTLFDSVFSGMFSALGERGVRPAAPPFALYRRIPDATVDLEIGVPIAEPLTGSIDIGQGRAVEPSALPSGSVAVLSHHGPYDSLAESWGKVMDGVVAAGRTPLLPFWEVYVTEPSPTMDPAELRTDLYTLVNGDTDAD